MERDTIDRTGKGRMKPMGVWAGCVLLLMAVVLLLPVRSRAAVYGTIGNGTKMYAWPLSKAELTVYCDEELTEE